MRQPLLWVAHQLLDWEWPGFLTAEFEDLLPVITVSCVVAIVANLLLMRRDPPLLKTVVDLLTSAVAFVGSVWAFRVFPFDFAGYRTDWSWALRTLLVIAIVGSAIAVFVAFTKLATGRYRETPR